MQQTKCSVSVYLDRQKKDIQNPTANSFLNQQTHLKIFRFRTDKQGCLLIPFQPSEETHPLREFSIKRQRLTKDKPDHDEQQPKACRQRLPHKATSRQIQEKACAPVSKRASTRHALLFADTRTTR